jgi:hypothetical protein
MSNQEKDGSVDRRENGPEFAPIRNFVKTFPIVVTIINKDDTEIRVEHMDYGKQEDRIWLGKLSYWAWDHGHIVETRGE